MPSKIKYCIEWSCFSCFYLMNEWILISWKTSHLSFLFIIFFCPKVSLLHYLVYSLYVFLLRFSISLFFFFFFLYFVFLGLHPRHMEVPRLGVESGLAYTTATATPDLSHICDLHCSSWQPRILNPLSNVRNPTCILMVTSRVCYCWALTGTPIEVLFRKNVREEFH